jgi:hypothetical protein
VRNLPLECLPPLCNDGVVPFGKNSATPPLGHPGLFCSIRPALGEVMLEGTRDQEAARAPVKGEAAASRSSVYDFFTGFVI